MPGVGPEHTAVPPFLPQAEIHSIFAPDTVTCCLYRAPWLIRPGIKYRWVRPVSPEHYATALTLLGPVARRRRQQAVR